MTAIYDQLLKQYNRLYPEGNIQLFAAAFIYGGLTDEEIFQISLIVKYLKNVSEIIISEEKLYFTIYSSAPDIRWRRINAIDRSTEQ